jgi:hypothetical protein
MARVGISGKLQAFTRFVDAIPMLEYITHSIENTINGQIDSTNFAAGAVTAAALAAGAVTPVATSGGIAQIASGTYLGDGTTANRTITLTFTPKYVLVLRTDATPITFESIASSGDTRSWMRSVTGAYTSDTTQWQGIAALAIKLGSNAAGSSNVAAVTYAYLATG